MNIQRLEGFARDWLLPRSGKLAYSSERLWALRELLQALVEPILHPSGWRVRAIGICTLVGHPLFYFLWTAWFPQPYESLALRLFVAVCGVGLLVMPGLSRAGPSRRAAVFSSAILWVTLPLFFSWMYLANGGNDVWLASMGAMFLIYYHLTDWRIATFGSAAGLVIARLAYSAVFPGDAPTPAAISSDSVVLGFCWVMGIVLGLSSSNLRREQLTTMQSTLGIMAHELRTPLATLQLLGQAFRQVPSPDADTAERLATLAGRLEGIVGRMNHQIDAQITNARLATLPNTKEAVSAGDVATSVVSDYPFRSQRERACVHVQVEQDFSFLGSRQLTAQVLENLLKNALHALASAASNSPKITITVAVHGQLGAIVVRDNGPGMAPDLVSRLFQPFVSTSRGSGHGLGLAFCQRVVQAANGKIRVRSALQEGATFTIELPKI